MDLFSMNKSEQAVFLVYEGDKMEIIFLMRKK